jgi:lipopolysaccharide/colanic/teichoic acid biosynthesis glycosyltransferase
MRDFIALMTNTWWGILIISLVCFTIWFILSAIFYKPFFKRFYDVILSIVAIIILSPLFILITILTAIMMKGNPFFVQPRPGKNEKIFNLIKFRTMTYQKDENNNLLPDEKRLTKYGKFLRSTSLDELPELINILKGDMSFVGPRPLLVKYLSLYNEEQRKRHNVRPGLTGYAQVHGRNAISWEKRFELDIEYINHITLVGDIKILLQTFWIVVKREAINSNTSVTMEEFQGTQSC